MSQVKAIPAVHLNKIMKSIERLERFAERDDIISEEQACELLGITKKTLANYRASGRIPENCYKQTVTKCFVYFKSKLCQLN